MSCPAARASTKTALNASPTLASGCVRGIIAGCTRTETASSTQDAMQSSLMVQPIALAEATSAAVTSVMPSR